MTHAGGYNDCYGIGYDDGYLDAQKGLFRMALVSGSRTHILLVRPPASAKTMFLTSLLSTSVFATCNDTGKLFGPLLSRFFNVELEPYTYYQITMRSLCNHTNVAPLIADAVWNKSRDLRDCVRIDRLARTDEDVQFLIQILNRRRAP